MSTLFLRTLGGKTLLFRINLLYILPFSAFAIESLHSQKDGRAFGNHKNGH